MPWQHVLALLDQIPRQRARVLVDLMTAARAAGLEGSAYIQSYERVRRIAYPGEPATVVLALRQSVEESHG